MINSDIREEIMKNRIKMWEIAERLGITDSVLSKKFRKELTEQQKNEIRQIINKIRTGE